MTTIRLLRQRELDRDCHQDRNRSAVQKRRLEAAGIAHARMNTVAEFAVHPQLTAPDRWREVSSEAGPLHALLPPVVMDDVDPVMGAVPALGAQTLAILEELAFDATQSRAGRGKALSDRWRRTSRTA